MAHQAENVGHLLENRNWDMFRNEKALKKEHGFAVSLRINERVATRDYNDEKDSTET